MKKQSKAQQLEHELINYFYHMSVIYLLLSQIVSVFTFLTPNKWILQAIIFKQF